MSSPFISDGLHRWCRGGNQRVTVRAQPEGNLAVVDFQARVSPFRKLLVIKLDHIGDFLMGLPALEKLRRAFANDHITLLCGPWNEGFARSSGFFDEIRTYRFFPEDAAEWDGRPVENFARFYEVAAGRFDIAVDLRVDEDTRFLLNHVEAELKCGIGTRLRHPFLNILLPAQFERREVEPSTVRLDPSRFQSQMPVKTPLYHETDFSITNRHIIYGGDLSLLKGRFRATWGLDLRVPVRRWPGVEIALDVARDHGSEIVASRRLAWRKQADATPAVEFDNPETGAAYEFRVHARGRPLVGRLRFFGVWVEPVGRASPARFKPSELHIGEQLSALVQLIEDRVRPLLPAASLTGPRSHGEGKPSTSFAWPRGAKRIALAPISNSPLRNWGLDNYSRLAARLLHSEDCAIALLGSAAQRDLLARIVTDNREDSRIVNLAGKTDWLQSAAVIREADLVISNNSGIAHLAAACGIATLAIYSGSHQPQEWGPRGSAARALMALVPCSPCGYDRLEMCPNEHLCMKLIKPEAVAAEALSMLSTAKSR